MKSMRIWAVLGTLALVLAACGPAATLKPTAPPSPTAAAVPRGPVGQLKLAFLPTANIAADPVDTPYGDFHLPLLYYPLFGATPDERELDARYGVLEKWEAFPDGKGLTMRLRQGLKFHNGQPITAKDVKFSIERSYGPESKSEIAGALKSVVDRVDIVDDMTVKVFLRAPSATFVYEFSPLVNPVYIVSKDYLDQVGFDGFAAKPLASGPYEWAKGAMGSFAEIRARGGKDPILGIPRYETIRWDKVVENATRVALLRTGQADIVETAREFLPTLTSEGFRIDYKKRQRVVGFYYFQAWDKTTFLNDLAVRRAASLAVDRDLLARTILKGIGVEPWGCTWPPPFDISADLPAYQAACAKPDPYDPEQARKILADAGYRPGQVQLQFIVINMFPEQAQITEAVQAMLADVGIKTTIVNLELVTWRKMWGKEGTAKNHLNIWAASNRLVALGGARAVFHTKGTPIGLASDPDLDRTLDAAAAAATLEEYKAHFTEFATYVNKTKYTPGFFTLDGVWAVNPKIPPWGLERSRARFNIATASLATYPSP